MLSLPNLLSDRSSDVIVYMLCVILHICTRQISSRGYETRRDMSEGKRRIGRRERMEGEEKLYLFYF